MRYGITVAIAGAFLATAAPAHINPQQKSFVASYKSASVNDLRERANALWEYSRRDHVTCAERVYTQKKAQMLERRAVYNLAVYIILTGDITLGGLLLVEDLQERSHGDGSDVGPFKTTWRCRAE